MGLNRIQNDAYILKVRELFRSIHGRDLEYGLSQEGAEVFKDAFFVRTVNCNNCILPWIESVFPLAGTRVLEIGGGSGASTLAIAQGAVRLTHLTSMLFH
jgi:hypothetical protein